jgi:hypothetical protein
MDWLTGVESAASVGVGSTYKHHLMLMTTGSSSVAVDMTTRAIPLLHPSMSDMLTRHTQSSLAVPEEAPAAIHAKLTDQDQTAAMTMSIKEETEEVVKLEENHQFYNSTEESGYSALRSVYCLSPILLGCIETMGLWPSSVVIVTISLDVGSLLAVSLINIVKPVF